MADINDLYLTDGIPIQNVSVLIYFIYSHWIEIVPIYILFILYLCCKWVLRSKNRADPTSTRPICEIKKNKLERWTAWLLVDLFRTPNVEKEMKTGKLYLKIGDHGSLELGMKSLQTGLIFVCTSLIFCFYINKLILDIFVEVTPTCIDTGDFGVPAVCYVMNTTESYSSNTSESSYPINCTTWNNNFDSFNEEVGLLFCFSFYYNILTSVTEIVGMLALQTFIIQVILTMLREAHKCVCCRMRLFKIIIIMISITMIPILTLVQLADFGHKKRYFELGWKQFTLTLVVMLSLMLPYWLLMSTGDSHKTKNTANVSSKRNKYLA